MCYQLSTHSGLETCVMYVTYVQQLESSGTTRREPGVIDGWMQLQPRPSIVPIALLNGRNDQMEAAVRGFR